MSVDLHHRTTKALQYDVVDRLDEALIEKVWYDLDWKLPRERVRCVVAEIALGFQDARVKSFLPIFIYRRALERLKQEINETNSPDGSSQNEQL